MRTLIKLLCAVALIVVFGACFVLVGHLYSFLVGDDHRQVLFMSPLFLVVNGIVFFFSALVLCAGYFVVRVESRVYGYPRPGFFEPLKVLMACYVGTITMLYICVLIAPILTYGASVLTELLGFPYASQKLFELRASTIVLIPSAWFAWWLYSTRPRRPKIVPISTGRRYGT